MTPSGRPDPQPIAIAIATSGPLAAAELVGFLAHRVVAGVEQAVAQGPGPGYARSVQLTHGDAVVVLTAPVPDRLEASAVLADDRDAAELAAGLRRLCDADVDAGAVDAGLAADPVLADLVRRRPGLRVPGTVDPDELAVRALVGQQVSLAGAAVAAAKITRTYGSEVTVTHPLAPAVTHRFPTMARLAAADAEALPMPRARGRALVGLAAALDAGELSLAPGTDRAAARRALLALTGIGPWTADYVVMRGLGDPDVLLDTDLAVRRELERRGRPDTTAWAPWRSYATLHLWHGYLDL